MTARDINRRLDRLAAAAATPAESRRLVLMQRDEGETEAHAIARWCAQNPGEPPPDASTDFVILRGIVSPNAR
jgi:hypothetical protein